MGGPEWMPDPQKKPPGLVLSIREPTLGYWMLEIGVFPSLCLWQLPYIPLITSVIFQSPSPGDSCYNSSLSPNSHPSPLLPPGLPSPLMGLFSPSPSPTHRASPHLCPLTQHPRYLRRSPQDPACSLHSAGHLSPAHTQVCHKVPVSAELKNLFRIQIKFRPRPVAWGSSCGAGRKRRGSPRGASGLRVLQGWKGFLQGS